MDSAKSTLCLGPNGSGKSGALSDTLCFALYGKPYRDINLPQLVNSINQKNMLVEVEFFVGPAKYLIRRGLKPSVFQIYKDGTLIKQPGSSRDYQDYLEKNILKLGYKSFCQIVILGNASFVPFMRLQPYQRREVIEDILDLQIFSTMNTLLKNRVTENKNAIQDLRFNLEVIEEKIDLQKKYIKSLEENHKEIVKELKERLARSKESIKEDDASIKTLQKEIKAYEEQIVNHDKLSKKLRALESLEGQLEDKIRRLRADVKFFEENDVCPSCKQAIGEELKTSTIGSKKDLQEKTKEGLDKLATELDAVNIELNKISDIVKKINALQHKITAHNTNITNANRQVTNILEDIEKHKNQAKVKASDLQQLTNLQDEKVLLEKNREDLLNQKNLLDIAGTLLKDGGIKTKIIKQYIPIINKLLAKYFSELDFFIDFTVDENFNEVIKSRFRDEFSYASFSEGEKQRIDLCLLFVWRSIAKIRNSSACNILIMDETFDSSLDAQGSEDLLRIIGSMLPDSNIFVVSHKQTDLTDKFDRTLVFQKVKNFSQMIEKGKDE